jgi:Rad3-related DNA helicase
MPYNYLISKNFRSIIKDKIENAIIIIDEAHNIEKFSEESSSTSITKKELDNIGAEFEKMIKMFEKIENHGLIATT